MRRSLCAKLLKIRRHLNGSSLFCKATNGPDILVDSLRSPQEIPTSKQGYYMYFLTSPLEQAGIEIGFMHICVYILYGYVFCLVINPFL